MSKQPNQLLTALRAVILVLSGLILLASLRVWLSLNGQLLVVLQFLVAILACAPKLSRSVRLIGGSICLLLLLLLFQQASKFPFQPRAGALLQLPSRSSPGLLSRIVTEEDGVFVATSLFSAVGEITPRESTGIWPPLHGLYQSMRERHGQFPTPLIRTYLGLESPSDFELVHLKASAANPSKRSLVFLHGFGGNWTLLCFIVAEAVSPLGIDTFCPSTGPLGHWSSEAAQEILVKTLHEIRNQGYQPVLLGGLSAGAIGAGMIAGNFASEFKGLIFLFGGHPDVEPVKLPSLYVFGNQDERIPVGLMRDIIKMHQRSNPDIETYELRADHFALIKQAEEVKAAIQSWVQEKFPAPIEAVITTLSESQ